MNAPVVGPSKPKTVAGYLHAIDLVKGKEKWRFKTGGQVWSSPAVVDGTAYFGCLDGFVYALK